MSKSKSLPQGLKTLLSQPLYPRRSATLPAGRSANPPPAPSPQALHDVLRRVAGQAEERGLGWGEWLSIATATMVTLNSPHSLQHLHRFASPATGLNLEQRVERSLLMREVGLKCIGFIGIPKVINNLAALRKAVDEDHDLSASLPTEPRRKIAPSDVEPVQKAAWSLWDDIYQPHSKKLIDILGRSHPDLPVFIVDGEYGPLFSPPHTFRAGVSAAPRWEVGRLRTSLVAIAALRAQGGVGPQVTSHVWGLIKAGPSVEKGDPHEEGLKWLTTEEGATWVVETVNDLSEVVESGSHEQGQQQQQQQQQQQRDSKL